jgi:hypothetical protein
MMTRFPGDVHGEAGPLFELLDRLGYDGEGKHKEGRHLVFVGDLVDRGPDSIAVVEFVRKIVTAGRAQMVIGNHEMNLLRGQHKHGNHWFWGESEIIRKDKSAISFQRLADDEDFRAKSLSFFSTLPLSLERNDCRVVHACWDDDAIAQLKEYDKSIGGDCMAAFKYFKERNDAVIAARFPLEHARRDGSGFVVQCESKNKNLSQEEMPTEEELEYDVSWQNGNPVQVVCSGKECRADTPFFAGMSIFVVEESVCVVVCACVCVCVCVCVFTGLREQ